MSASPTKEATESSESKATEAAKPEVVFTDKEERTMKVAWSCLKSGPPDVDLAKLQVAGGFNTLKTATNTWGTIKKKLQQLAPLSDDGAADGTPKTPKAKATTTPKKRASSKKSDANGADAVDGDGSPKKKRKTPSKKLVKAEIEDDADSATKTEED